MTPRHLAWATALACLLPITVQGADLPTGPIPPTVPPDDVFFWEGPYAGVHASLMLDASRLDYSWFVSGMAAAEPYAAKVNRSSFGGGLYGGWNRSFGSIVTGVEVDATLRSGSVDSNLTGPGGTLKMRYSNDVSGSARARAGYAFGRLLVFGTLGIAYGQPRMRSVNGTYDPPPDGNTIGWAAGLGLDYAIPEHAIARIEYLHMDFGSRSRTRAATLTVDGVTTAGSDHDRFRASQDLVRAGLAYKF